MAENRKYSLFLGCVIPNRYPFIEKASRNVLKELDIELVELFGATCCSAPGVFRSFDINSWMVTAARNLTIAEDLGVDIISMCNGCYGTLLEVNHTLKHNEEKKKYVNEHLAKIGREFKGTINVKHIIEVLYKDIGIEAIKKKIKRVKTSKLDLDIAVHYGCHILKPSGIRPWDNEVEDPRFVDELVEITGCRSLDYRDKRMCCGAGGGVRTAKKGTSLTFTLEKLKNIRKVKADAIVTTCPFCHLQYDLGQLEINSMFLNEIKEPFRIPVIYYTQLLGLALGLDTESVGLTVQHELTGVPPFTSLGPVLAKIGGQIEG
ncbi:MAG: CoB--CoM heterodisulfide reductase subunit B [Candidatus Hodarchaeota archaeon]